MASQPKLKLRKVKISIELHGTVDVLVTDEELAKLNKETDVDVDELGHIDWSDVVNQLQGDASLVE